MALHVFTEIIPPHVPLDKARNLTCMKIVCSAVMNVVDFTYRQNKINSQNLDAHKKSLQQWF